MTSGAIVVTGSAGLIGFSVAVRLAREGRTVTGTDRVPPYEDGGFPSIDAELTDIHKLHAICSDPIDAIIHCGAVSGPMLGRDNPRAVIESNVAGTANMLEIARQRGVRRFVFCSSTSAYGDSPPDIDPVPEAAPLTADDIYGATKASGDILTRAYVAQTGLDAAVLRFSWVYGPRRRTTCVIREMIQDAQAGRPTQLPYGRGFSRQYVHIDDVVGAVIAALDAPEIGPSRAFNITAGVRLDFSEIAETVSRVLPAAQINLGEGADPEDQIHTRFDISAAGRVLGWEPTIDFEQGVRSYADWLAEHPV
jgi:nucleoside-diphosphate-sugar epimerase